jgi:hypothetical protein
VLYADADLQATPVPELSTNPGSVLPETMCR